MKKIVSKRIVALLCSAVLTTGVLAGCGEKKTASKDEGPVTITIGNFPNAEADPAGNKIMKDKFKRFEKMYPDIKMKGLEWSYDTKSYVAQAEGGTLPKLYRVPFTESKKIIDLGYASDITSCMKKNGYYDMINDDVMKNISRDGKIYFIPNKMYSTGLIMNLNLFREAGLMNEDDTPKYPKTFDELIDTARIITEKTGKPGFAMTSSGNAGGWIFTVLAWNYGVSFIKQTDDGFKSNFDCDECVKALEYIKDLRWKYDVLPKNAFITNQELFKLLGTNQVGMGISQPSVLDTICSTYGLDINSIGMAPIPSADGPHCTLVGGDYYVIKKGASDKEIDAACKWIEFEGQSFKLTDAIKKSLTDTYNLKQEQHQIIGVRDISLWNEESEIEKFKKELIEQKTNVNLNHFKAFNEQSEIEYHSEEPVCAQELYNILDGCIQKVLTNKDTNCKTLLKKAANDFQNNCLDYEN